MGIYDIKMFFLLEIKQNYFSFFSFYKKYLLKKRYDIKFVKIKKFYLF